ncbi:26S proteasome non-ATPase regulatory subunit 13 B [Lathyrus oleraceus]|uniref:26S proteasome non-ATPase regulatory subunit 13 B n=1 Tax=Pisum sativum TaxID=3888 RepID=A0A9D4ZV19_PEA|nr:26S proteasome non-ATPase regulatory subunit 13 B [Pisum sativum]
MHLSPARYDGFFLSMLATSVYPFSILLNFTIVTRFRFCMFYSQARTVRRSCRFPGFLFLFSCFCVELNLEVEVESVNDRASIRRPFVVYIVLMTLLKHCRVCFEAYNLSIKLHPYYIVMDWDMAGDALIQLYNNFITDFETKINLLKLAHFAVMVSRQYSEKEAAVAYLEGVIEKLQATREQRIEEPILYIKMQIALFKLEQGDQKECKNLLENGKSTLDSMTDIDPTVYASYYWVSSQYHKSRQEFAEL